MLGKELQVQLECTNSSEGSKDPETCRITRNLLPGCKLESTRGYETMLTLGPAQAVLPSLFRAEAPQELMWSQSPQVSLACSQDWSASLMGREIQL